MRDIEIQIDWEKRGVLGWEARITLVFLTRIED